MLYMITFVRVIDMNIQQNEWYNELLCWLYMDCEPVCMIVHNALEGQKRALHEELRLNALKNILEIIKNGDAIIRWNYNTTVRDIDKALTIVKERHLKTSLSVYKNKNTTDYFEHKYSGDYTLHLTTKGKNKIKAIV